MNYQWKLWPTWRRYSCNDRNTCFCSLDRRRTWRITTWHITVNLLKTYFKLIFNNSPVWLKCELEFCMDFMVHTFPVHFVPIPNPSLQICPHPHLFLRKFNPYPTYQALTLLWKFQHLASITTQYYTAENYRIHCFVKHSLLSHG